MNKKDIICPGDTIKELMEVYNYNSKTLSEKTGIEISTVNKILNGKAPITHEIAIKLEEIFNVDVTFWDNLQLNYLKEQLI